MSVPRFERLYTEQWESLKGTLPDDEAGGSDEAVEGAEDKRDEEDEEDEDLGEDEEEEDGCQWCQEDVSTTRRVWREVADARVGSQVHL